MTQSTGLPRRTGHRVFPSTALRRHWPMSLSDQEPAETRSGRVYQPRYTSPAASAPQQQRCGSSDRFTASTSTESESELSRHVNSLAALMHPHQVVLCVAEVRPYARSELCCLTRHHFRACPTPAPAITSQLIHSAFAAQLSIWSGWKPDGSQVLRLASISACHRPYSGFPIAANSHCFTIDNGLRPKRRGSACIRVKPGLSLCTRLSQQCVSGVISHGAATFA